MQERQQPITWLQSLHVDVNVFQFRMGPPRLVNGYLYSNWFVNERLQCCDTTGTPREVTEDNVTQKEKMPAFTYGLLIFLNGES